MIIDIHSHIIPFVDDGSSSLEHSISLLEKEAKCGTTDIICTPHYRNGLYTEPKDIIEKNFQLLKVEADKLGINLYLGTELFLKKPITKQVFQENCFTLANTNYVLIEFDYRNYVDISEIVYEMKLLNFFPIIAHIERYSYVSMSDVEYFIESGALIQINAESIVSKSNREYNKNVMKYIKKGLVHFVASDVHHSRSFYLGEAYEKVKKKFGNECAEKLFYLNAKKIIYPN